MAKTAETFGKRFVIVGLGGRSSLFSEALLTTYKDSRELVGLCDINQTRMDYHNQRFQEKYSAGPFPTYKAADFDRMIAETKPDTVIVTTMDRTHHTYIVRAMELGCDVISEKPMTTDTAKCRQILDTVERTGRKLKVTFNYRYAPSRTKVKELIATGVIGKVNSIHFEWLLDTRHGADYFRRWHRDKRNSGGLMVHKSTHHFDLVNWWLDSSPETVFGLGNLAFYGRDNAEARGVKQFYVRGTDDPRAKNDPFALDLHSSPDLEGLYFNAEKEDDAYLRDRSVFSDGINIEDTMNVLVRYRNGCQMSYSLTAYAPWEGLRIAFNGDKGRIELEEVEKSYVNAGGGTSGEGESSGRTLLVRPQWQKPYEVEIDEGAGSHGGGDVRMLADIFGDPNGEVDPWKRAACHIDGARSILTGIAANASFATGQPVRVDDLVRLP
jgi:predicted dehydrogenase